jgi:flagellar assembly factor FliW
MAADETPASGILQFPEGLPGFESHTQFILLQDEEVLPIVLLTSVAEPRIHFPVVPVERIRPDYQLRLSEEDRRVLRLSGEPAPGANLLCLAILNLGDGRQPASANLFAPIVINLENRIAKQVIQPDSSYSASAEV